MAPQIRLPRRSEPISQTSADPIVHGRHEHQGEHAFVADGTGWSRGPITAGPGRKYSYVRDNRKRTDCLDREGPHPRTVAPHTNVPGQRSARRPLHSVDRPNRPACRELAAAVDQFPGPDREARENWRRALEALLDPAPGKSRVAPVRSVPAGAGPFPSEPGCGRERDCGGAACRSGLPVAWH